MTTRSAAAAPVLVFGWGNPGRGDDALGPMFVERLQQLIGAVVPAAADLLTDFQLQVEHALDLAGRRRVLFVDASLGCQAPFEVTALQPGCDASYSTHAMSPQSVMQVFRQLHGAEPPPCLLLAIRGERFDLGDAPSEAALSNLALALAWCRRWLASEASPAAATGP
ncbi:MAG: hydrogenase maturation protease [Burkholderiales bacterium]|nr:hydrogenase maturation protease [Burkholderiales bacterium]